MSETNNMTMMPKRRSPLYRLRRLFTFIFFYLWEVLLSNLVLAHDVVTPRDRFRPGILALHLPEMTDLQIIALTNLVTMTPGTLTLDVSEDRRTLFMHCMYLDNPQWMRRRICEDYVMRIKEIF